MKPSVPIIRTIYSIGLPAIISQALMSVMTYGLNRILANISTSAVTAYGLYYKIQQFILFAAFGLRDAITPIAAFSSGMRDRRRVLDTVKYGVLYTFVIMAAGLAVLEICAKPLAGAFGLSDETESLCISAIRIISVSFIFAGFNIACQGVFQALDSGVQSLVISLLRQLVLVLPLAYVFAGLVSSGSSPAWLVWTAFIISEGVSAAAALVMLVKRLRADE